MALLVVIGILPIAGTVAASEPGVQFIENKGQWDEEILYMASIRNGYLMITTEGLEYLFYDGSQLPKGHHDDQPAADPAGRSGDAQDEYFDTVDMHAVSLEFIGSEGIMSVVPEKKLDVFYNYYIGSDTSRWADHVKAYQEIQLKDIYPGIHMAVYSQHDHLKYDLIVESHADAKAIQMAYRGIDQVDLSNNSIYARTTVNTIIENAPFTYQLIEGDTIPVTTHFTLEDDTFGFEFPDGYDTDKPIIIDPTLVFSTYSGSNADNWGNTATFDSRGYVYSGGTVRQFYGIGFPVTRGGFQTSFGGVWDIGILKFDSTGSRLMYGTYLGGSGTETPLSIIANNNDELIILGITGSEDFPTTENAYSRTFQGGPEVTNALGTYNDMSVFAGIHYLDGSDLFVTRLSESGGTLLASTYLGGSDNDGINNAPDLPLSRNYGDEFRGEVNVDPEDNIYIATNTSSPDFPVVNGFQSTYGGGTHDGILAKLTPDLSTLIWSSFLGGERADAAYGIKIIPDSVSYVTGGTMSPDFPVTEGTYQTEFGGDVDGYLAAISSDGSTLVASTLIGTNNYDQTYFLDTDPDRNVYVLGQTRGLYPVSEGVYVNPYSGQFIHKFSPDLRQSLLSTVVGSSSGTPDISPTAFLVNECGNIFLSGWGGQINSRAPKYIGGNTFDMPITNDAFQRRTDGSDFYLMVLDADASRLLYATFLGAFNTGGISGEHVDGGTCRFDKRGIVYHAICACRDDSQFPTTPNVWSNTNNSPEGCNNGVFKFDLSALRADFTTNSFEFDSPGITRGCMPFEVVFLNRSFGGEAFEWDFGDGSAKSNQEDSLFHIYEDNGVYTVTLKAFDENTCLKVDIARKNIVVFEPLFIVPDDRSICQFDHTILEAGGAISYDWWPSESLTESDIADPVAQPDSTTMYYLDMRDANGCVLLDSVLVTVLPDITTDFSITKIYDCYSHPRVELLNTSLNANQYEWSFGDGSVSTDDSTMHSYEQPGTYTVRLNASNEGRCVKEKEEEVNILDIYVPNVITPNGDQKNDYFEVLTDARIDLVIFNRWGKLIYEEKEYRNNWNGSDVPAGTYFYEIQLPSEVTCKGWLQVLK